MAKFMVSITHAKDNTDKATVGFVVANASAASGIETVVFLITEGVRLAPNGYWHQSQAWQLPAALPSIPVSVAPWQAGMAASPDVACTATGAPYGRPMDATAQPRSGRRASINHRIQVARRMVASVGAPSEPLL